MGYVSGKIQGHHLEKLAVVYVRQSTARQVLEHRESTDLQYKLANRAVALSCGIRSMPARTFTVALRLILDDCMSIVAARLTSRIRLN
jgi:hypothetical protein